MNQRRTARIVTDATPHKIPSDIHPRHPSPVSVVGHLDSAILPRNPVEGRLRGGGDEKGRDPIVLGALPQRLVRFLPSVWYCSDGGFYAHRDIPSQCSRESTG